MSSEAKLSIDKENRELRLQAGRFTIGRSSDNDLCIDNPGLSRRQAVIELFDGIVQISDCGSLNGTFVNDSQVKGTVVLRDGDEISFGCGCTLTIHLKRVDKRVRGAFRLSKSLPIENNGGKAASGPEPKPLAHGALRFEESLISHQAAVFAAIILFLTLALAIFVLKPRVASTRGLAIESSADKDALPIGQSAPTDAHSGRATANPATDVIARETIEGAARQVLKQISDDDQSYDFPPDVLADISAKIDQYRDSEVFTDAMKEMASSAARIAAEARRTIAPGLVVYTGMAEAVTTGDGRTSVKAAERCRPKMTDIWKLLGNRTSDDALLLIAAYRMGPVTNLDRSGRKSHPLLSTLRRVSQGVSAKRTVWYLRNNGGLDGNTYDFVISFLSVAVISREPDLFGVSAQPLVF